MSNPLFIEDGKSSYFGEYIYDQFVPQGHLVRQMNHFMN
jgi:hypothetical protein